MNERLDNIYNITINLKRSLQEGNYEEFEQLLNVRNDEMNCIEAFKDNNPDYKYSSIEKQLLTEIFNLNKQLIQLTEESQKITQQSINKMKNNKHASKYKPYFKQINGVFVDEIN